MVIRRARTSEAKAQRAEDLLAAAEALALELGGVRFVTLAPVTERAGLHRTAVRRYYESKEELLLGLAERGYRQWRDEVISRLRDRFNLGPLDVADVMTEALVSLPVFCDTYTHISLKLEGDVSIERARRFKENAFAAYDEMVDALTRASTMSKEQVYALGATAGAAAANFWQLAHPTATLAELYKQEPRWGHVAYEFEPKLRLTLRSTAVGLLQTLPAPPDHL
jgi:AcrR family transcriptional regulator